jgi:hypothetical protein
MLRSDQDSTVKELNTITFWKIIGYRVRPRRGEFLLPTSVPINRRGKILLARMRMSCVRQSSAAERRNNANA